MQETSFESLIRARHPILMEGSLVERLTRELGHELDPHISNASLLLTDQGRAQLAALQSEYIGIGREASLPLVLLTPTWRANPERLEAAGVPGDSNLNAVAVDYLKKLRDEQGEYAQRIYIGGLMGVKGDAYAPAEALSEKDATEFHRVQATQLTDAGVDFLIASTVPAASEAVGLANAFAATGTPYIISYVIRPEGTLLDGTPLHEIVTTIDNTVSPKPVTHLVNCVHPSVFLKAMEAERQQGYDLTDRIIGLQANTSARSPEELDGLDHLEGEDPEPFGRAMAEAASSNRCTLLGGCCGTDARHIREIATWISSSVL
ncbi:homocysteine S-methyltransferase family protein [bacterium]|nr:homocysteine S-methyltransferase family protein [bacterium]